MPAYKDTNGTYFVSFYYEDFRGVKKRKMKRGFARRRDALDWERRFLLQSTADLNMKFSDFVEIYRNDKQMRIRESTWESKNNMIDLKILPYFKDRPINAIEPKDIIAWQNEIMNQTASRTRPLISNPSTASSARFSTTRFATTACKRIPPRSSATWARIHTRKCCSGQRTSI